MDEAATPLVKTKGGTGNEHEPTTAFRYHRPGRRMPTLNTASQEGRLASRPQGIPTPANFAVGEALEGRAAGGVVESRASECKPGDAVIS